MQKTTLSLSKSALPCIAVDCRMLHNSGVGTYIRNIVPLCIERMPEYSFRLLGRQKELETWMPVPAQRVDFSFTNAPIYSIKEQFNLIFASRGSSILWVPHYNVPIFCPLPLVVTVHDLAHVTLPEYTQSTIKQLYAKILFTYIQRKARLILTVSDFTQKEFIQKVGNPRYTIKTVHNGIDASWFKVLPQEPFKPKVSLNNAPYFIAVGNVKAHKRIGLLCRSFAKIAEQIPHHLVIIGKTSNFIGGEVDIHSLQQLFPERIHFTQELEKEKLQQYVQNATALVFPSIYEGFGLPPLEALAMGTSVLLADIPVLREIYGDGVSYFRPDNEQDLSRELLKHALEKAGEHVVLDEDTNKIGNSAKKARQQLAKHYTWERAAQTTVEYIRKCMQSVCGKSMETK